MHQEVLGKRRTKWIDLTYWRSRFCQLTVYHRLTNNFELCLNLRIEGSFGPIRCMDTMPWCTSKCSLFFLYFWHDMLFIQNIYCILCSLHISKTISYSTLLNVSLFFVVSERSCFIRVRRMAMIWNCTFQGGTILSMITWSPRNIFSEQ